jgi:hypothetical protein
MVFVSFFQKSRPAGDNDHRHLVVPLAQVSENFKTVHARHPNSEGLPGQRNSTKDIDGVCSVENRFHLKSPLSEAKRQAFYRSWIIIRNQNALGHCSTNHLTLPISKICA